MKTKLLIITQAVDKNNPVLGFFHRWIEEFAKHFESIEVICLFEGEHSLPANVHVHSLGKEKGSVSRLTYSLRFLSLIWKLRSKYEAVFVHMNQEYVLLGGLLWKSMRKRVYMWRNHYAGTLFTTIAVALCDKVFCTSKHSYTARFKKTVLMPVGVDTSTFKPDESVARIPRSILSLGRISPSKHIDVLIEALRLLKEKGIAYTADIYGDALPEDSAYLDSLKESAKINGLDTVVFHGGVRNADTPRIYHAHEIFVNTSSSGMYDKTIFEAAAAGCIVLATSEDFKARSGENHWFSTAAELGHAIEYWLQASTVEKERAVERLKALAATENLPALGKRLFEEMR